jgi:hypothetical protein
MNFRSKVDDFLLQYSTKENLELYNDGETAYIVRIVDESFSTALLEEFLENTAKNHKVLRIDIQDLFKGERYSVQLLSFFNIALCKISRAETQCYFLEQLSLTWDLVVFDHLDLASIDSAGTLFFISKLLQSIQQPAVTIGILHKNVECPLFLQYFGTQRYHLPSKVNPQSLSQSVLGNSTETNPLHLSAEYFTQTNTFQFIEDSFIPLMQRERQQEDGDSSASFLSLKNELRPTGFVVQGETGSGKTFLLRWMAKRLNYHLMEIPSADLIHKVIFSEAAIVFLTNFFFLFCICIKPF